MNNAEELQNNNDKKKLEITLSWLPFSGLMISFILAIIFFINKRQWSVNMVLYILMPLVVQLLIYFIIQIIVKGKLSFPYLTGKIKYLTLILLFLLFGLILNIYFFNKNIYLLIQTYLI